MFRYLEETAFYGNLVRGWEGFIDSKPKSGINRKEKRYKFSERIFSYGSCTSSVDTADGTFSYNENTGIESERTLTPASQIVNEVTAPIYVSSNLNEKNKPRKSNLKRKTMDVKGQSEFVLNEC